MTNDEALVIGAAVDQLLNGETTAPEEKKIGYMLVVLPIAASAGDRIQYISSIDIPSARQALLNVLDSFNLAIDGAEAQGNG